ncbi:MAG: hypothetical protein ACOCW2_02435 [Chitinivibrionales bacterium]
MYNESEFKHFFIEIGLSGYPETFTYNISHRQRKRLHEIIDSYDASHAVRKDVVAIDTVDGITVLLFLPVLDHIRFISEPFRASVDPSEIGKDNSRGVRIFFQDRLQPLAVQSTNLIDLEDVFLSLDGETFHDRPFLSFTTDSDEIISFNAQNVILMEIPSRDLAEAGEFGIDEENPFDENEPFEEDEDSLF